MPFVCPFVNFSLYYRKGFLLPAYVILSGSSTKFYQLSLVEFTAP